jgi:hypothetical protein
MASRWKRPSATKMMASVSGGTTGAVQPSTCATAWTQLVSLAAGVAPTITFGLCHTELVERHREAREVRGTHFYTAPWASSQCLRTSPGDRGRDCGMRSDG